jgi:hypothetical protein
MLYTLVSIQTMIFCSMWISNPPTMADWKSSCPAVNWGWGALPTITGLADVDTWLFIRAVEISSGEVICEVPAFNSLSGLPCPGMHPVDAYLMQIVFLDAATLVCTVYSDTPPRMDACADVPTDARLEWRGPYPVPIRSAPVSVITPPRPAFVSSDALATAYELEHLSYWMTWYGLDDPIAWQNQWDEAILGAGHVTNVPPEILKAVIGQETQFWPMWTGIDGEVGLIQLTWDGADTALRFSPELYSRYCPLAIWPGYCWRQYDLLAGWQQERIAAALVSDLTLTGSPIDRATQVSDDLVTYARVLAAYYSYSAALGWEGWTYALAAYNAGGTCILTGEICKGGKMYVSTIIH